MAGCSGTYLASVAESHRSGRLRRPYHLEPLTYFGGTAQEAAEKKMGDMRDGPRKWVLGHPPKIIDLTQEYASRCAVIHRKTCGKMHEWLTVAFITPEGGRHRKPEQGEGTFH